MDYILDSVQSRARHLRVSHVWCSGRGAPVVSGGFLKHSTQPSVWMLTNSVCSWMYLEAIILFKEI